jgi:hypothetical protein
MFWQVDQGRFTHLGRTLVLDALDLLQGLVDGGFVGQQGIGDVELAFLFGGNGRHPVQRALITAVVGKAGARFQTGDVSLAQSVGVFPQGGAILESFLAVSRPFGATSRDFQEFPLSVVPILDCGFPIFIVHQDSASVRFILFAFAPIT